MAQTITSLDRVAVEALSSAAAEPAWLRDVRIETYERYAAEPSPTERSEGWRRLSLAKIDLTPPQPQESHFSVTVAQADRGRGATVLPLDEAVKTHADLLQSILCGTPTEGRRADSLRSGSTSGRPPTPRSASFTESAQRAGPRGDGKPHQSVYSRALRKYSALAQSLWSGGAFIYVPDGLEMSEPIVLETADGAYPHTLVIIGANARASISEIHRESGRMTVGITELILGTGSHLTYVHVQDAGRESVAFSHQRARVGRDAKLVTLNFGMGGRLAKNDVEVELEGSGAESEMLGVVFAHDDQQFDYHTLQGHRSPHTRSDLLFKNALDDRAHSLYTGVIIIDRGAQRSDAYQANRNLLLSEGARADTEPRLEIEADDVRCTHGATVGPIDEEQVFYLGSRGLDEETAGRLIVEGFFEEVFAKVGDERLTKPLAAKIAPHLDRKRADESP